MKIETYLDSTYLKTPRQSGISDSETLELVRRLAKEAMDHHIYAVIVRPNYVNSIRLMIDEYNSDLILGTVIDFPEGRNPVNEKLMEAQAALANGADELDFVIDYTAFKNGSIEKVREEINFCSGLVLKAGKVIKWIIETAALNDTEIVSITQLIRDTILNELEEFDPKNVFIKSSTGFYETPNGEPNGANAHVIGLMLKNAGPLPVKASGGVRTSEDAQKMIKMGVKRIGTSSALEILSEKQKK